MISTTTRQARLIREGISYGRSQMVFEKLHQALVSAGSATAIQSLHKLRLNVDDPKYLKGESKLVQKTFVIYCKRQREKNDYKRAMAYIQSRKERKYK